MIIHYSHVLPCEFVDILSDGNGTTSRFVRKQESEMKSMSRDFRVTPASRRLVHFATVASTSSRSAS